VANIFFAEPQDYVKAVQRVYHSEDAASFIELPVVPVQSLSDGKVN
jgi:predicted acyl esterase